jgi:peptidoglycan-associated lipoprotein
MIKPLAAALAAVTLVACSSTPINPALSGAASVEERRPGSAEAVTVPPVAPVATGGLTPEGSASSAPVSAGVIRGMPLDRSVFFDYDSFAIKPQFKGLIEAHARFLVANPRAAILVQGNTDERGSREYNLALGQKRADVVKKALMLLGVREDQIESVSLGEEKPRNAGVDESAWADNRRSDILYSGEF